MAESGPEPNFSDQAALLAQSLARTALGREPTPEEAV